MSAGTSRGVGTLSGRSLGVGVDPSPIFQHRWRIMGLPVSDHFCCPAHRSAVGVPFAPKPKSTNRHLCTCAARQCGPTAGRNRSVSSQLTYWRVASPGSRQFARGCIAAPGRLSSPPPASIRSPPSAQRADVAAHNLAHDDFAKNRGVGADKQ